MAGTGRGRVVVTGGAGRRAARSSRTSSRTATTSSASTSSRPEPADRAAGRRRPHRATAQAVEALRGAEAVVHLAAIPAPGPPPGRARPSAITRRAPTTSSRRRALLGLERVVWASSETVLGLPFEREPPAYAPIDEEHPPRPDFSYALSKLDLGGAGAAVQPLDGHPVRRPPLLERHGAARLRALPRLLGRPAAAALEPLGLRRRARRRAVVPARARGGPRAAPRCSSSRPPTP